MQAPVRTIGLDDVRHDPKVHVTAGRPPAPSHGDAPLSPNGASHFDRANGCEAPQGRGLNS